MKRTALDKLAKLASQEISKYNGTRPVNWKTCSEDYRSGWRAMVMAVLKAQKAVKEIK